MPSRTEFQQLADLRVTEASVLLGSGHWSGAYYLAGYAVEFGLKACIAKLMKAEEYPPHRNKIDQYYTHEVGKLVKTAGLETEHGDKIKTEPDFRANWNTVKQWSEEARYGTRGESEARELFAAITDGTFGVLTWIKRHW